MCVCRKYGWRREWGWRRCIPRRRRAWRTWLLWETSTRREFSAISLYDMATTISMWVHSKYRWEPQMLKTFTIHHAPCNFVTAMYCQCYCSCWKALKMNTTVLPTGVTKDIENENLMLWFKKKEGPLSKMLNCPAHGTSVSLLLGLKHVKK